MGRRLADGILLRGVFYAADSVLDDDTAALVRNQAVFEPPQAAERPPVKPPPPPPAPAPADAVAAGRAALDQGDAAVAAWLEETTVQQVEDLVAAADEANRPEVAERLAGLERARPKSRKTLLAALDAAATAAAD